ncbi:hypothetical protein K1719_010787 [Acacia pycnantha]|nr:hypothetical protein K1719_010787 [Acacia pycnantha]
MAAFLPGDISQNGTHGVQRHPEMSEDGNDLGMRLKVPQVSNHCYPNNFLPSNSTFVIPLEGKIGGSLQQCACFLLGRRTVWQLKESNRRTCINSRKH